MSANPTNVSTTHDCDVVYDMVDLPPFESKRTALFKLMRVLRDLSECVADARTEFVYLSQEERKQVAEMVMNALLK